MLLSTSSRPVSFASTRRSVELVATRAGRSVREGEDGKLVEVNDSPQQAPLFADEAAAQLKTTPKKSNLSREMKQKLREEYVGLGGSEGKAMSANYFLYVILFVGTLVIASYLSGAI